MPEKARVFVAEDDKDYQWLIEHNLIEAGHSVVLRAETFNDAVRAIGQFGELGVQVATIDGNFTPNDTSGFDGLLLVEAISRLAPQVKTVGLSGSGIQGVTVDLGKEQLDILVGK